MTTAAATEFDPTAPVAEGVTVLEASAGTGKTHAVSSLVVREVAEGRPLDQLLVVTFTRKATGELRERVWRRLTEAADALAADAPDPVDGHDDPLLAHLRRGDESDRTERRRNLRVALSDFDAATIATTHGFCQQVLAGLGVAGEAERDVELVEDVGDLVDDAVRDLYVRRVLAGGDVPFGPTTATAIARAVVDHPDCTIAPVDQHDLDRQRFARTVRRRIDDQKRKGRLLTYDDLLDRLDASLVEGPRGRIVAERLRARFSMAVVDEFQDTDSIQWRILHRAFGAAPCRLVLVGDPKQAIYAFRGGDVHAYLEATRAADHQCDLSTNRRSDQPLLSGLDALFAGAQLGDPAIRHRPVRARPGADGPGIEGPAGGPPLSVRLVRRGDPRIKRTGTGLAEKPAARRFIADDLAAESVRLLHSGSTIAGVPLRPSDLAVLTRTRDQAIEVQRALRGVGVPAVVHGAGSVWASPAARHWSELLEALEQPTRTAWVRTVAVGPFVGWDAARLAAADEADWEDLDALLHDWAATARTHSTAAVLRRVEAGTRLSERLLGEVGGDRLLSDLRHLAELLHARQAEHPSSLATLAGWAAERRADAALAGGDLEGERRRLETDSEAVAVMTVHGAKGLEFPIVLLPSPWDVLQQRDEDIATFHDQDGQRALSVGSAGGVRSWQLDQARREDDEEELRLLYVALTRARHRVIAWWATAWEGARSPLARLLLGTDPATGAVVRRLDDVPSEDEIAVELTSRHIPAVDATGATGERYEPPAAAGARLSAARFDRTFDRSWVRTSYSGLTRAAHETGPHVELDLGAEGTSAAATDAEREEVAKVDEPALEPAGAGVEPDPGSDDALPLPLADVPGGARVGTLVHEVLERVDFTAPDLVTDLAAAADAAGASRLVEGHEDVLVAGVALALQTPWGPAWDDVRLCDLTHRDRLDELAFDLPLAGGDRPHDRLVTMAGIAEVFAGLPADDPLADYHERLRDPLLDAEVRGFLSGSIDLVARLGDGPGGGGYARHVVVDYKTNHLAPHGEVGSTAHYRPDALAAAMQDAHYPLQAALYAVAVHRFLRWRLPDYDPTRHLGGVAYLFLRGMVGPDSPRVDGAPCGVFTWQPPTTFVTDLSDLLDRGAP